MHTVLLKKMRVFPLIKMNPSQNSLCENHKCWVLLPSSAEYFHESAAGILSSVQPNFPVLGSSSVVSAERVHVVLEERKQKSSPCGCFWLSLFIPREGRATSQLIAADSSTASSGIYNNHYLISPFSSRSTVSWGGNSLCPTVGTD